MDIKQNNKRGNLVSVEKARGTMLITGPSFPRTECRRQIVTSVEWDWNYRACSYSPK